MPYIDGKRVSNEEWIAKYGSIQPLHTGPNGDNPASAPKIDAETGTVKTERKPRSQRSTKAVVAAVADALGVKVDSEKLAELDVSGLDAETGEGQPTEVTATEETSVTSADAPAVEDTASPAPADEPKKDPLAAARAAKAAKKAAKEAASE